MNILCFTDTLGSGGAQRQLVLLATLLQARGHSVRFVTYGPGEHFAPELEAAGMPRDRLDAPIWRRPLALRALLRQRRPDAVIAFQDAPALYAELASLGRRSWRLVVSERHARPPGETSWRTCARRQFHRLADVVTTNSVANRKQISASVPALGRELSTVYNAVNLQRFRPASRLPGSTPLRFAVVGSHKPVKNGEGLARALRLLLDEGGVPRLDVSWYGDEAPGGRAADEVWRQRMGLTHVLHFYPPTPHPERVLAAADALILPSLWEGLPNAACEALASGCPVLMSDVSDARHLVCDGITGFLFDPRSPRSIAGAIRRFCALSPRRQMDMRVAARQDAERLFDPARYVAAYESLLVPRRSRFPAQLPSDSERMT